MPRKPNQRKSLKRRRTERPTQITHFRSDLLTTSFGSVGTSWALSDLTGSISLGTEYYQRLGRLIRLRDLEVKGVIRGGQSNLATDDNVNLLRVLVVVTTDSFTSSSLSGISLSTPISTLNVPGLVRVLRELYVNLRVYGQDSTGYIPSQQVLNWRIPLHLQVVYNSSSAMTRVYMLALSDSLVASNPGFVSGFTKLNFENEC